jgi:hypothetical protein
MEHLYTVIIFVDWILFKNIRGANIVKVLLIEVSSMRNKLSGK